MPKKAYEERVLEPNYTRYTFRQPKGINVKAIATQNNMTVNELLRTALIDYLEKNQMLATN